MLQNSNKAAIKLWKLLGSPSKQCAEFEWNRLIVRIWTELNNIRNSYKIKQIALNSNYQSNMLLIENIQILWVSPEKYPFIPFIPQILFTFSNWKRFKYDWLNAAVNNCWFKLHIFKILIKNTKISFQSNASQNDGKFMEI